MRNYQPTEETPRLPNGEIDYSGADIHNDFAKFPPLFKSPKDIENFIKDHKVNVPVLSQFLYMLDLPENPLHLTDTEKTFYFNEFFYYVYDVYRIPVPETYEGVKDFLRYYEGSIINGGLQAIIAQAFQSKTDHFDVLAEISRHHPNPKFDMPVINCHDIKPDSNYYETSNKDIIEAFWIKTDKNAIQPEIIDNEAYARVWVRSNSVYIFGCDDASWSLCDVAPDEVNRFVYKLKRCCPVWNFSHPKFIHHKLEFTN